MDHRPAEAGKRQAGSSAADDAGSMSVSADPQSDAQSSMRGPRMGPSALITFFVCLIVGLTVVGWRAIGRADAARSLARTEALARGEAVELQLSQAVTAAEVLGALAWQSGGAIVNFQQVATELLKSRPSLASLELQPGGVVTDIVPRAGHERAMGVNVLNDPSQRQDAYAAIQRRALTVAGPVSLSRGEPGIVARVPVFQRGRDGRDSFWGLIAVSMRLSEALAQARVDALAKEGYDYAFISAASTRQKAQTIAGRGAVALQDAVLQPVRVQNLEFRLALARRGGWIDKTRVLLEAVGVSIAAAVLAWLAHLLVSRRAAEAASAQAERQLAREIAERKRAEQDCRAAQDQAASVQAELKEARSNLQRVEPAGKEAQARLEAMSREARAASQSAQAARNEAESRASQLQKQLETVSRAAQESAAVKEAELDQARTAIGQLEARLKSATRSAAEAAEANAARLKEAAAANRELKQQRHAAEQAQARVAELSRLLEQAKAELERERGAPGNRTGPPQASSSAPASPPAPQAPEPDRRQVTRPPAGTPATDALKQDKTPASAGADAGPAAAFKPAAEGTSPAPKPPPREKPLKGSKRTPTRRDGQMDLFAGRQTAPAAPESDVPGKAASLEEPAENKPAPARRLSRPPSVNPVQLRKAVNLIVPLLSEQDPGAKDCLKANHATFRAAFGPEGSEEFEQKVRSGDFSAALELLKKVSRKNGIAV